MKRFILAAVMLAACGRPPRGETLMEAVRTYNDGVRWERFAAAAAVVPAREREAFLDEREELAEDLRISEYEVVRVKDKTPDAADVQVKLTWYQDSVGTVRKTWARQRWERQGQSWRITGEEHVRGDDMPGLDPGSESGPEGARARSDRDGVAGVDRPSASEE